MVGKTVNEIGYLLCDLTNMLLQSYDEFKSDYEAYFEVKRILNNCLTDIFGDMISFNIEYEDTIEAINIKDPYEIGIHIRLFIESYNKKNVPNIIYAYDYYNDTLIDGFYEAFQKRLA